MVSLDDSRQFVLISKLKMPNESVEILIPEDETTALSRNTGQQTHSNMAPRNSQKNGQRSQQFYHGTSTSLQHNLHCLHPFILHDEVPNETLDSLPAQNVSFYYIIILYKHNNNNNNNNNNNHH
jgi:hypothetical protein